MRWLAIGDIHGHLRAFQALLDAVALTADDRLVTLGDYVDRGPDVCGVVNLLLQLEAQGQLIPLIGNHERLMLDARQYDFSFWLQLGGRETLASYCAAEPVSDRVKMNAVGDDKAEMEPSQLSNVPAAHWEFFENRCRKWYETEDTIFVHAGVDDELPLDEQSEYDLCWKKFVPSHVRPHHSGKRVICGHTAQKSGEPLNLEHHVCIDTWIYGGGFLTCLDVASNRIWQANAAGEVRQGWLPDPIEPGSA